MKKDSKEYWKERALTAETALAAEQRMSEDLRILLDAADNYRRKPRPLINSPLDTKTKTDFETVRNMVWETCSHKKSLPYLNSITQKQMERYRDYEISTASMLSLCGTVPNNRNIFTGDILDEFIICSDGVLDYRRYVTATGKPKNDVRSKEEVLRTGRSRRRR